MVQFTYIGGDYMETGNQNSWFYVRNRQQEGPISLFELTKMFEQGVLDQNTLIWTKDARLEICRITRSPLPFF